MVSTNSARCARLFVAVLEVASDETETATDKDMETTLRHMRTTLYFRWPFRQRARIAKALSFPVSFFYQPERAVGLPLSVHPMHRKRESVSERGLKRVHAELNFRLIHLRKMLAAVEIGALLPLPWMDVDDAGGPQEIARAIRRAWIIPPGPIENLTDCVERRAPLSYERTSAPN